LEAVKDIPVFVYLDPCGLPIPMDEVAIIFDRPSGLGTGRVDHVGGHGVRGATVEGARGPRRDPPDDPGHRLDVDDPAPPGAGS